MSVYVNVFMFFATMNVNVKVDMNMDVDMDMYGTWFRTITRTRNSGELVVAL
jgi:hypothetical protein